MHISQPGMEGGNALADVLTGKVTPGGKLTGTWAKDYGDIPNAENYSHNNGDVQKEYYTEGIYVGYRYFDSFRKETAYPFGFGLSYTSFSIRTEEVCPEEKGGAYVTVTVKNTGRYLGGPGGGAGISLLSPGRAGKRIPQAVRFCQNEASGAGRGRTAADSNPF